MTTAITEWLPLISGEVKGCPNPIINKAVLWSCRDFCAETRMWQERLAPQDSVASSESDIAFVSGSPGTITGGGDFSADGWAAADTIMSNSLRNSGIYTIDTGGVAAGTLTLIAGDDLFSEDGQGRVISKASYPLASENGEIEMVQSVKYKGYQVYPTSRAELDNAYPEWELSAAVNPTNFFVDSDKRLRLYPMPSENHDNAIEVWVILKPTLTATSVEDFLFNNYVDTIKFGALSRLFEQAGQSWGNIELSSIYDAEYKKGRNAGYDRAHKGFSANVQWGVSA